MAELVDALVSGISEEIRGGSSPLLGTNLRRAKNALRSQVQSGSPGGLRLRSPRYTTLWTIIGHRSGAQRGSALGVSPGTFEGPPPYRGETATIRPAPRAQPIPHPNARAVACSGARFSPPARQRQTLTVNLAPRGTGGLAALPTHPRRACTPAHPRNHLWLTRFFGRPSCWGLLKG